MPESVSLVIAHGKVRGYVEKQVMKNLQYGKTTTNIIFRSSLENTMLGVLLNYRIIKSTKKIPLRTFQ